ncbi:MAG TPA: hypothetical protein VLR94_01960, partial [Acidobacteriota bacterium]|nr:hypothetical protein [Acidobacteriota bacterium]
MKNPWPRRLLYIVLAGCYYYYFRTRIDSPADIILSVLGGLISGALIYSIPGAVAQSREAKLFLDAMRDQATLQDGKLSAAAGRIVPVGLPLLTPFQKKECVAYEYQETQQTRAGILGAGYLGFAVMPCAIQTPAGEIRLKAHARVGPFQEEAPFLEETATQECLQSLSSAEFQDTRLPQSEISQASAEIVQNPETVSRNWRRAGASLAGPPLERYLRVGEKVCVIGTYSAADHSLMPKYPMTFDPLRKKLIALNPADVQTATGGYPLVFVFVLLFVNAALFGGVHMYGRFGRDPMDLIMAVESDDVSRVEHLIGRGFDPNAPERDGETPLYFARKGPVAESLIRAGANINPPGDKTA